MNLKAVVCSPLTSPTGSVNSLGRSRLSVSAQPKAPSFVLSVVTMMFMS